MHLPAATLSTSKPHMQAAGRCQVHTKRKWAGRQLEMIQNLANQNPSKKKKRKEKKVEKAHCRGEKKSLDNKNNDSTGREEEWVWTDNEAELLVNTTLEYKVDKCSLTPLVLSAGWEEMHMYKLLPVCRISTVCLLQHSTILLLLLEDMRSLKQTSRAQDNAKPKGTRERRIWCFSLYSGTIKGNIWTTFTHDRALQKLQSVFFFVCVFAKHIEKLRWQRKVKKKQKKQWNSLRTSGHGRLLLSISNF